MFALIQRSLYGLKQAPGAWFQRFAAYATRVDFQHSHCDTSLFIYRQGTDIAYLLLYVDDIVLTPSTTAFLQQVITSLHKEFSMTDLGPLNYFLGIFVTRNSSGMFLSQQKYATEILERAALFIIYVVFDWHIDADWAGCTPPNYRRSTSGVCVFSWQQSPLSGSSKRQVTISRSSAEAEYRGVANTVAETCWLRNLLRELHSPLSTATLVYCDNVSVVYLSSNPVQHQRTKHIEIDIHFVRDLVSIGHIYVLHVPSRYQYADIFTKGLPTALFDEFRSSLSVRSSPAPTAGGVLA
ncbi:ribonuclease H-like domain-containing protein [Tanacetum coccineum]|uniref:Ribonuclease H-like domain-containing protein n=1 Tax=Tanacetum coccineum TaxID=301880 RepID=A0ABQ5BCS4_9ASTR